QAALSAPDNGSIPLFRSRSPSLEPSRTFPSLTAILNGSPALGEQLPGLGRIMDFRVTARDNRPGGGATNSDDMFLTVSAQAGPFRVTAPNTSVSWSGTRTVTWDVAGTDLPPVSTTSVDILLSTDGGNSFSVVLASGTPNDGSETVTLPNITTS